MSGTFTLSLDVEMAWGSWQGERWPWEAFAGEPEIVRCIDELATALKTPVTFGVVGALAALTPAHLTALPPGSTVDRLFPELTGRYAPGTLPTLDALARRPEAWTAPSVVRSLQGSPAGHELCSHTFFHTLPIASEGMRGDVAATRAVVGDLTSLIYPQDRLRLVEALPSAGVNVLRGTGESRYMQDSGKPRRAGRLLHLADQVAGRRAPLARVVPGDPVRLTTSAFLTLRTGVRRRIPPPVLRRRFLTPLHESVRTGGNYHLWSHPWNLALPGSDGLDLLGEVLQEASRLQAQGDLQVLTMRDLARPVLP